MRCRSCSYPLWNTPAGNCPECGDAFLPSSHTFKRGEVIFQCPDCEAQYFGDTEDGHLNPQEFNCVGCARRLREDECVLFPSDGDMSSIVEYQCPWFDKGLGVSGRWFGTIGWSMAKPTDLANALPGGVVLSGLKFMLITIGVASIFGLIPNVIFVVIPQVANAGVGVGSLMSLAYSLMIPGVVIIGICLEGLLAHAVLRLTGGAANDLGQTMAGIFFGSGPYIVLGIPCLSPCVAPVVLIWSLVGKSIILSNLQQVSIQRGIVAASVIPLMLVIGLVGLMIFTVNV